MSNTKNKKRLSKIALGAAFLSAVPCAWAHPEKPKISVGIEGGLGLSHQAYDSTWIVAGEGKSNYDFSGQHGAIGLRLNIDKLSNNWVLGATAGMRHYFNERSHTHASIGAHTFTYKTKHDNRYELSFKAGRKLHRDLLLYVKGGGIVGCYDVKVSDYTFSSHKSMYRAGFIAGIGFETPLDNGISFGGLVDYEKYEDIRGNLTNIHGTVGRFSMTPSMTNVMLTLSVALNQGGNQ